MPPDPSAWGSEQEPRTADTRQVCEQRHAAYIYSPASSTPQALEALLHGAGEGAAAGQLLPRCCTLLRNRFNRRIAPASQDQHHRSPTCSCHLPAPVPLPQFYNEVFLSSMEGYTASDLFEDSASGVSGTSPSAATMAAPQQEGFAGSGSNSEETQMAERPAGRRRRTPLAPHAAAAWRKELEAPAPSNSTAGSVAASVAASGSRGRSAVAAATAAKGSAGTSMRTRGGATVKAAAVLGAVKERRPLGFVDRNQR